MLDHCQVTVKSFLRQCPRVPDIGHHQKVCAETVRLLREAREAKGLSRYAVGKKSGISESMLSLMERGLRNPSMELMLRAADAVGAELPDLIRTAQANVSKPSVRKR